jgi:penicillin-binding protein 1A
MANRLPSGPARPVPSQASRLAPPPALAGSGGVGAVVPSAGGARPGGRRYPHSVWWYFKWLFIIAQLVLFCAIVVVACIGKGLYDQLTKVVPDTRFITSRSKAEPTKVYASDRKTVLAEFKGDQRIFVPIDSLKVKRKRNGRDSIEPGSLINATLSIEDARFYTHPGMDAYRIAGALVANVRNPDGTQQGGSTITEQLAVNIYLTRTKTLARRLQTALLALQLEKRFSKDEILELYLNEIYYGNRAYGCEAASQRYFGKSAKTLSIAEAAMLAGLPQQPGRLDPFEHYDRAKKRQRLVLKAMLENKKISWGQYLAAIKDESLKGRLEKGKERFRIERTQVDQWKSPYFVAYVKQYLQRQYDWSDEFLSKSGLKIYTTLDFDIQKAAVQAMTDRLNDLGGPSLQGALVCIDPWTGRVLAMYGGRDYYDKKRGQFNRATQAKRQPGSTFKPFVYATAMEMGYSPESVVIDKPVKINGWEPKNYEGKGVHYGPLTFRKALGISNNVAATRVLLKIGAPNGIQNVVQKAHLMGINSPLAPYPSLGLGSSEITLLENTSAYGVFCTRGMRAEPTPIIRVDNYAGETLVEQPTPVHGARVLSEEAGNKMWDMLRYVVTSGTGRVAQIPGVDVIGKTGTTSDNKDVWFMGGTRKLVTGVWMGYDKPKNLGDSSAGGRWCAPAWRRFMLQALDIHAKRNPVEKMIEDTRATQLQRLKASQYKKYVNVMLCRESGLLGTRLCPETVRVQFSAAGGTNGGAPTQPCYVHQPAPRSRTLESAPSEIPEDRGRLSIPEDARTSQTSAELPARGEALASRDSEVEEVAPLPEEAARSTAGGPASAPPPESTEPLSVEGEEPVGSAEGGEVVATVCAESGQIATGRCPVTVQQFFLPSQVPRARCTTHR